MRLVSGAEMRRDYCHLPYCCRDVSDLSGRFLRLDRLWDPAADQPRDQRNASSTGGSRGSYASGSFTGMPARSNPAMFHVKQEETVEPTQANRLG
jgi:hypothetical protein